MYKKVLNLLLILLLPRITVLAQWEKQTVKGINPNYLIQSIAVVNENVVWAIADTNSSVPPFICTPKFLRTTNGGLTWKTGNVGSVTSSFLMDICAIDSTTAWVTENNMAGGGGIYKTTDGGDSWIKQISTIPALIHFFDAQNGVQINVGFIHITTNGGTTWTPVTNVPSFAPDEFTIIYGANNAYAFVGDTIWVGTTKGRVYRSADRGQTWNISQTSLGTDAAINSLAFKDSKNGLAASSVNTSTWQIVSKMARTTDGGETWTAIAAPPMPTASCITYIPGTADSYVMVAPANSGETPGSAYTKDGGATWTIIDSVQYYAVAFVAPNIGWAGGFTTATHGGMYRWTGSFLEVSERKVEKVPQQFGLSQNYPNPFNPSTTIAFSLPQADFVTLKIYNVLGKEIASLVSERLSAGNYQYQWNATGMAAGVYFYQLRTDKFSQTRKMVLMP